MSWFSLPSAPAWLTRQRLSYASQGGDLETIQKLIDPTNVNAVDAWGNAPLHNAALKGHAHLVEFILGKQDLGADVNVRDSENHTPLLLAAASGGAPETEGHIKTVQLLIHHKADLTVIDDMEYTALMLAVVNENVKIAQVLLESLSEFPAEKLSLINRQNQYQFTALHAACERKNKDLIDLLIKNGANSDIQDALGRTPKGVAKEGGLTLVTSCEFPIDGPVDTDEKISM